MRYIYPIVKEWQLPVQDVMGSNFSKSNLSDVLTGVDNDPLNKFMDAATLLTVNWTKAQYGWCKIPIKDKYETLFGDDFELYKAKEHAKNVSSINMNRDKLKLNDQKYESRWDESEWAYWTMLHILKKHIQLNQKKEVLMKQVNL